MLNPYLNDWIAISDRGLFPEFNKPCIILIEHDVIHDPEEEFPFVRKAILIEVSAFPAKGTMSAWQLMDYDPETEEEILQQCFTVVAWRYWEKDLSVNK
jgi:hypothetical protein